MAATTGLSNLVIIVAFYIWIASIKLSFNMFLKCYPLEAKNAPKELKLKCANFLGQTS